MQNCPRCHQPVDDRAVTCPSCRIALKAYGHPGIPLHRATGEDYLCQSCIYDADDTCTFPKRPYAQDCTLYHNVDEPILDTAPTYKPTPWFKRNPVWLIFLGLLAISFLLVL
ncbi:MAG: zinc ribbon domain-containing protein [Geitlerinemataceae cyanobacterium]